MTRCRAWFWHTAGGLFCYGLIVLAWVMIRCGIAPTERVDPEPTDTKQAA